MTREIAARAAQPTASVVICCYTEARWTDLEAAIVSVQQQWLPAAEVVVVVDYNPALLERIRAHWPSLRSLPNAGQRGLSGARNTGIAAASGEVVVFLDDDAAAEPDWLTNLLRPYANRHVLGVGGYIEPAFSSNPPAWFPDEFRWVVGCSYRGLPSQAGPVRNLIGANMSFRRELFEHIDGFRSELGHNGQTPGGDEETELCIRVHHRWRDAVLMYVPSARVRHHVPSMRTTWNYFKARCFAEGLNKARVSRFVGARDGLASERAYTLCTLPSGMLVAVGAAVRRRDFGYAARAGAIAAGLAMTTAGYTFEMLRGTRR